MATFADLPLELVSLIASLLSPPFYPSQLHSSREILDALDPRPQPVRSSLSDVSSLSRTSHLTLQAARPWLWENVNVTSGRGWLAIVNALTEEVIEVTEMADILGSLQATASPTSIIGIPVSPQQAHAQPMTINDLSRYITPPSSSFYPSPYATGVGPSTGHVSGLPPMGSPQPPKAAMLLTPPGSRNASPVPISSPQMTAAKIRGRSRSPRRSLGIESSEGISAVLDRSRSLSLHRTASSRSHSGSFQRRRPLDRRTSMSRTRTISDMFDGEGEEEDEEDDIISPLPDRGRSPRVPTPPKAPEPLEPDPVEELLPSPGPYIRHVSFVNFRTIGSGRTQDEAVRGRFVTAGRLEGVIKNAPNLVSLCMTEYVDSSLSLSVIEELVFRGYRRPRGSLRNASLSRVRSLSIDPNPSIAPTTAASQFDPPRPTYVPYETETGDEMWRRRNLFTPLQALDLTGCVSRVFTEAMTEFWETWYNTGPDDGDRSRGRTRHRDLHSSTEASEDEEQSVPVRPVTRRIPRFNALKRLSLRACTSLPPQIISDFVCSFANLTHLDLSGTRIPNTFLEYLIQQRPRNLRLVSLSLARCARLSPNTIVSFLLECPCAAGLTELNLYSTPTQSNALSSEDVERMLHAPCFKSGNLRYLDISGCDVTAEHLAHFPSEPKLISLGLSHIPSLALLPIQEFLLDLAPNVEILTLTGTAFDSSLSPNIAPLRMTLELHARLINPLTSIPFSLSDLSATSKVDLRPGPARLRVIELSSMIRSGIADGASSEWKVVKSKGGRGWYVDLSAGWLDLSDPLIKGAPGPQFVRHLPASHPQRQYLAQLSAAGGRVSSGVGWHTRKMEIVTGMGMLGREEGMAGAGGFAFEE